MNSIKILPFVQKDDAAALALENLCVQGKSLRLKFQRPFFTARSELYDNYKIYCAKAGEKLIGTIAGAVKSVRLHGRIVEALYVYDLRIHPDYRRQGIARQLSTVLIEDLGKRVDCFYTLIHGQNNRAFSLACNYFAPKVAIPLTYAVLPVYKLYRNSENGQGSSFLEVNSHYTHLNKEKEFVSNPHREKMKGHVSSLLIDKGKAGCSIWTNENILAEQVVKIPFSLEVLRVLFRPLRPFLSLPRIPRPDEILRSWFLFDLFAADSQNLRTLLRAVNNSAFSYGKDFLYLLLQDSDPLLTWIKRTKLKAFTFPYYLLAKGKEVPGPEDPIAIDVRDL